MAVLELNLSSERTHKARLARLLSRPVVVLLLICAVLLGIGGIVLLFVGLPLGWFLVGLAVMPAMFVEWYHGELKALPADQKREAIDAWLES